MASTQGKYYNKGDEKKLVVKGTGNSKFTDTDWNALREEWVTTNISLAGLARKYNISLQVARRRYQDDHWSRHLEEYNAMVEGAIDSTRRRKAQEMADRVLELDEVVLTTSERVLDIVASKIDEVINKETRPEASEIVVMMKEISKTIKDAHYNIRLSGDKATNVIRTEASVPITPEEEKRVQDELGIITRRKRFVKSQSVSEEECTFDVDSSKSPSDPQE